MYTKTDGKVVSDLAGGRIEFAIESKALDDRKERELLVFRSGSRRIAVFAEEADDIVAYKEPAPLPLAPPAVVGITNLRGRMFTVVDICKLIDDEGQAPVPAQKLITLLGEEQLSLAVQDVEGIVTVSVMKIDIAPKYPGVVQGTWASESGEVLILDLSHLFAAAVSRLD